LPSSLLYQKLAEKHTVIELKQKYKCGGGWRKGGGKGGGQRGVEEEEWEERG